ncbi:MAG: peptide chain release factor N(5)-glutamine methyltransferase [Acidimicrobiales bacterium]|nr:peptide chain release factor N(5)-glutamine methyltransferase [Acidimicrobiales bacterium]
MTGLAPDPEEPDGPVGDNGDGTVSWRALLAETAHRLGSDPTASAPASEARWLIEEASGIEGSALELSLDSPATIRGVARLDAMVERRLGGEPIQYVLGHWSFRTLDLMCDGRVLIPRPETEQVVGWALDEMDRLLLARPEGHRMSVLDLGTGSGAIGLSVAKERPGTDVWLVDRSADALAVARANLSGLGMSGGRVRVLEGSWFDPLPEDLVGRVDVVISNPPYIAASEILDPSVVDWEPSQALVSGPDGLECHRQILSGASRWLADDGVVVLEIGATQAEAVVSLARDAGFGSAEVHSDHAGLPRCVVARR